MMQEQSQAPIHPHHTLSEILARRERHLRKHMDNARAYDPTACRDAMTACIEEIASIEYWLRIVEEAERTTRLGSLFEAVRNITQAFDERL